MTHRELCILACRWLARKKRCEHTFAEIQSQYLQEFPDAIGFHYGSQDNGAFVVECKTSISDFRADKNKTWRAFEQAGLPGGMGLFRYYLVPDGLVAEADVAEDHGLLYAAPNGKVRVVREAPRRERRDVESEMHLLCKVIQRHILGIRWIPSEYRFETVAETKARQAGTLRPPERPERNEWGPPEITQKEPPLSAQETEEVAQKILEMLKRPA